MRSGLVGRHASGADYEIVQHSCEVKEDVANINCVDSRQTREYLCYSTTR